MKPRLLGLICGVLVGAFAALLFMGMRIMDHLKGRYRAVFKVCLTLIALASMLLTACAMPQREVGMQSGTDVLPTATSAPVPSMTASASLPTPSALPATRTPVGIPMEGECAPVRQIPIEADQTEAIAAAIVRDMEGAAGQPPPTDIEFGWILQEGEWILVAGRPNGPGMEGGIFALREDAGGYQYVDLVWAGQAMSESEIRQSIATYAPGISPTLVACVDVSGRVVQSVPEQLT